RTVPDSTTAFGERPRFPSWPWWPPVRQNQGILTSKKAPLFLSYGVHVNSCLWPEALVPLLFCSNGACQSMPVAGGPCATVVLFKWCMSIHACGLRPLYHYCFVQMVHVNSCLWPGASPVSRPLAD